MTTIKIGQLFSLAYTKPLSTSGAAQPGAQMFFYASGAFTTQQTVYADAGLTTPLSQPIVADASGRFVPVFLNPALFYSWQLLSAASALLQQADPVNLQDVSISVVLVKPADTSRAATVAVTNDPDLVYSIPLAGTYRIEMDLLMYAGTSGLTPGLRYQLNFTGTVNGAAGSTLALVGQLNGSPPNASQCSFALNTVVSAIPLGTSPTTSVVRIAGTIQATSAGTLSFQWAQNISSASATTIGESSNMTVTRIG